MSVTMEEFATLQQALMDAKMENAEFSQQVSQLTTGNRHSQSLSLHSTSPPILTLFPPENGKMSNVIDQYKKELGKTADIINRSKDKKAVHKLLQEKESMRRQMDEMQSDFEMQVRKNSPLPVIPSSSISPLSSPHFRWKPYVPISLLFPR
eukprot:TRINITY_DN2926_c0_g1_i1.p1 TRINITY_DN2926_c0_g1~~TRINITY_DN2926_c0_g1_i1.p1  ORF type:complete len:151 (+),score=26.15 TRINITY_DN2926_c0_g1_i1:629-1081(+)